MTRQYGRIPRSGRKPAASEEPTEIRMVIPQTYTLEQFALEVQRGFHLMQEYGATGLVRFRAQLMPLDGDGQPVTLHDDQGQPVQVIRIPELAPEKPYSDNEPGVGILPSAIPGRSGVKPAAGADEKSPRHTGPRQSR